MSLRSSISILAVAASVAVAASQQTVAPENGEDVTAKSEESRPTPKSYAWTLDGPLGTRTPGDIDTLMLNYAQSHVPSLVSPAYALTGNFGAEGRNMLYMSRRPMSTFFFKDALYAWLPAQDNMKFYNTRIPMTLLSYNTGGSRDNSQDRLHAIFSGNANARTQVGAMIDYIYSKGSYDYQADNDLSWGFNASYVGDRFEVGAFYYHYNFLNKENGGITDDLYILDPAEIQGGSSSVDAKSIPTRLTASHSKVVGGQFLVNARYKLGFSRELPRQEGDTIVRKEYVPVTSFIYQLNYNDAKHIFKNTDARQNTEFWENTYFNLNETYDRTQFWQLKQTVGIELLEGFNKYAKAGLAAYLNYDIRDYKQTPDTISFTDLANVEGLTPYPYEERVAPRTILHLLSVGLQISKRHGRILTYGAQAELGLVGITGEISASGWVRTRFKLLGDTVGLKGYASYSDETQHSLVSRYVSNHFIWNNDFGRTRALRFGGQLELPHIGSFVDVGVENVQGYLYFNEKALPQQHSGSVQVFSASLHQDVAAGIWHWDNRITYQTSSRKDIIPLPALAVYSNMYLLFKVARVLDVQFGIDCDYYTRYKAPAYQPATMIFHNQNEIDCGNYPFMNAYINFRLSKARFYVMMSHFNQGLFGGSNYFSMPHYPLNPRRFQLGVSVDFAN